MGINSRRTSLVDEIQDEIIGIIIEQEQKEPESVGKYVFSEGELSEKFRVSRSTVREAIRSLEVRGFVERVHGVGIRLIDNSLGVVQQSLSDMFNRSGSNYEDLLQVRRILEVQAVQLAARFATDEIDTMKQAIQTMQDTKVPYDKYVEADLDFHKAVVKATKNKTLESLVLAYQFVIKQLVLASTKTDFRPEVDKHIHKQIMDCIINKDEEGAMKAMSEHLNMTEQNLEKNLLNL